MSHLLLIDNTSIRQIDGLYCLNDLHHAAGGENKHEPTNFMRNDRTQSLINEINRSANLQNAIDVKQGGINQGTYVCKELVYAYAMWVSAKFHLHVIRAFDAQQILPPVLPKPKINSITINQSEYIGLLKDKITLLTHTKSQHKNTALKRQTQHNEQISLFIQQVVSIIRDFPGINKKDLLANLGYDKRDKTRNQWLDDYDGIHWVSQIQSNIYSYYLIQDQGVLA